MLLSQVKRVTLLLVNCPPWLRTKPFHLFDHSHSWIFASRRQRRRTGCARDFIRGENRLLRIRGLVCTNGILNSDVVPGFPNVGTGNSGGLNQGILNGGTNQQGILNFGGGSLVGLAPGGHLLGIGG